MQISVLSKDKSQKEFRIKFNHVQLMYYSENQTHKFTEIDFIKLLSNIIKRSVDLILTRLFSSILNLLVANETFFSVHFSRHELSDSY